LSEQTPSLAERSIAIAVRNASINNKGWYIVVNIPQVLYCCLYYNRPHYNII